MATTMTPQDSRYTPLSADASIGKTDFDPQCSAWSSDEVGESMIGELIGDRYRIERELGQGGMGTVYLVNDEQIIGESFAIKVLKQEVRPEALAQLREEVRKTRKLSHPNIVDVHSVNLDGNRLYILMEHLEGKSLDGLLDEEFGRGMPLNRAWPIIEDVGAALANAHNHSVIHCDLKPANIFVTISGRTKLLDFGIARVSRGPKREAPGEEWALTPAYASCEMLEGREADRRDDIYSYACVIYEMLCGERPFGRRTALEARGVRAVAAPIPTLTREQNAALAKALSLDRERRTGTVEELLAGLATNAKPRFRSIAFLVGSVGLSIGVLISTYVALHQSGSFEHGIVAGSTANGGPIASSGTQPTAPAATRPTSIAVLPFVNISGDAKKEYFSDGLSEELIDHLVHSTDLQVIARSSSFQFKGQNGDVRSIARILNVTHLLEGSVRMDGQQLRITAQLVRGSDGVQIWSQTYDRNLVGVFKIQHDISERVAQALNKTLRASNVSDTPEPDVRAYNLVLEGNYFKARRNLGDVEKAVELYRQAIDINHGYALAWARLASAYFVEENLKGRPSEEQNRRILSCLNQSLELDPNLAWAYYTRAGFRATVLWDWAGAKADTERVREVDPQFSYLESAFGEIALTFGELDKAIQLYRSGLRRNPLDPNMLNALGTALCAADRLQECLQIRLSLARMHPDYGGVNRTVGVAYLLLGEFEAALKAMETEPNDNYRLGGLALAYWAMGRRSDADAALQSLRGKGTGSPYEIAMIYAYRGEVEEAFRWLGSAFGAHDSAMLSVKTDPMLKDLRSDPRFHKLLVRMTLADEDRLGPGIVSSQDLHNRLFFFNLEDPHGV
jgi:TolB-like protein